MDAREIQQTVREVVEPTVTRCGFELVAVQWLGGGILRMSIDRDEGVTIDDCVYVSEAVSPVLDQADPVSVHYTLEVSSPGIERPLQRVEDFRRFEGYEARIKLVPGHPRRNYRGRLAGCDDLELTITVDGQDHVVALDTIERAQLVLDLDEYQKLAEKRP